MRPAPRSRRRRSICAVTLPAARAAVVQRSGRRARSSRLRPVNLADRPTLVRGVRAGRPGRGPRRHGRCDRVAAGAGAPPRRHLPRARRGAGEHLRPARPRLVVGVLGRARRVPRRRRRGRRARALPRHREGDGQDARRPVRPRLVAARRKGVALPAVPRHRRLGRGALRRAREISRHAVDMSPSRCFTPPTHSRATERAASTTKLAARTSQHRAHHQGGTSE